MHRAKRIGRVLFPLAAVALVCFIWGNSLADGQASGGLSGRVTQAVNQGIQAVSPGWAVTEHLVRKSAHFAEHWALGVCLTGTLACYGIRLRQGLGWVMFACLLVPAVDEGIQLFSPGRSSSVGDVWLDFAGACAGVLAALAAVGICRALQKRGRNAAQWPENGHI